VYKWIERAQSNDPEWYLDESRAPKRNANKLDRKVEAMIVQTRQQLVRRDTPSTRYAYHGAVAIHQRLDQLGVRLKPHPSTINRVLKRNDLLEPRHPSHDPAEPKAYYPDIRVDHPGQLYELDLVTPRYISGYGRVISVNRVDVFSSEANLDQYLSKAAESVIEFVTNDWKEYPKPNFLKIDNESSFRGSLYHPRTFGKLTRFCLNFGVQLIFIPFSEPWRNPYIESFNGRFNEQVWLSQKIRDLDHLKQESLSFRDQHNSYQRYKKEQFGKQQARSFTTIRFAKRFTFDPSIELPITPGKIHFIRWVNERGYISILNESFFVDKNLCCEYVWSTINTAQETLTMHYQASADAPRVLVKTVAYKLRERVKERIPSNRFS